MFSQITPRKINPSKFHFVGRRLETLGDDKCLLSKLHLVLYVK